VRVWGIARRGRTVRRAVPGPHVIGWATGVAASTVHAILRRHGCSQLKPRLPRREIIRLNASTPGTGSGSNACSPITGPASNDAGTMRAANAESACERRGPTCRRPTGKQGGSSARCSKRWAYAYRYGTEPERAAALPDALDSYNRCRPHRPRRADAAPARQRPIWDEHLA
jgi:hypothetical protein